MCSFTNAIGTSMKFFFPCLTKPGTIQKRNYYSHDVITKTIQSARPGSQAPSSGHV
jgi:hypothetical protein